MFSFSQSTFAGGISLGATRVVYPMGKKEVPLSISNSDEESRFLIQSWVEDSEGHKSSDFVVTPPLFVSKPNSENTLRIMYVGPPLAKDRESVFWLNSKAIPSADKEQMKNRNVLQFAILSRIKLFVRPDALPMKSSDAPKQLKFHREGSKLVISNPSPYYVTLIGLKVGSEELPNTMVAPKEETEIALPSNASGSVTYQTINDYGGNTPVTSVTLN